MELPQTLALDHVGFKYIGRVDCKRTGIPSNPTPREAAADV
jgi:hypothetical protein